MNKFTELVKQWRIIGNYEGHAAFEWLNACACDLESLIAEHMTWVQITEDESTWPEAGTDTFMRIWSYDANNWGRPWVQTNNGDCSDDCYQGRNGDVWWRPLNDNDYPPNSKED